MDIFEKPNEPPPWPGGGENYESKYKLHDGESVHEYEDWKREEDGLGTKVTKDLHADATGYYHDFKRDEPRAACHICGVLMRAEDVFRCSVCGRYACPAHIRRTRTQTDGSDVERAVCSECEEEQVRRAMWVAAAIGGMLAWLGLCSFFL